VVSAPPAWSVVTTLPVVGLSTGKRFEVFLRGQFHVEVERMTDKWTSQRTPKRALMSKMMGTL
jgi:hypothetical protein